MRKKGTLYSLVDIAMMVTGNDKYAAQQIDRIKERYHEVSAKCRNLKFPGRGQRETPVGDIYTVVEFIMLLPRKHAGLIRTHMCAPHILATYPPARILHEDHEVRVSSCR